MYRFQYLVHWKEGVCRSDDAGRGRLLGLGEDERGGRHGNHCGALPKGRGESAGHGKEETFWRDSIEKRACGLTPSLSFLMTVFFLLRISLLAVARVDVLFQEQTVRNLKDGKETHAEQTFEKAD